MTIYFCWFYPRVLSQLYEDSIDDHWSRLIMNGDTHSFGSVYFAFDSRLENTSLVIVECYGLGTMSYKKDSI